MRKPLVTLLCLVAASSGCLDPAPLSVDERDIAKQLARHFEEVFPGGSEGLLRPRFGIPVILESSTTFPIAVIQRGAAQPLSAALLRSGDDHAQPIPLDLAEGARTPVERDRSIRNFSAHTDRTLAPGHYDLVVGTERVRHAVFVRAPSDRPLSVVQLSDLHLGRPGQSALVAERLAAMVQAVNVLAPDVVVVTGDMAEDGHDRTLEDAAALALLELDAPMIAIIGNHDHAHWPNVTNTAEPDRGYYNFAHAFHGYRFVRMTVGGWDFVGFDSGQATFSLRVVPRGMRPETLALVRGTIVFSHALARAELSTKSTASGSRFVGSMRRGSKELEETYFANAARERVIHLGGHTHWSDLFFVPREERRFQRVTFAKLVAPLHLDTPMMIINAPSITRITFPKVQHAADYGFVHLQLLPRETVVQFLLYDKAGHRIGS